MARSPDPKEHRRAKVFRALLALYPAAFRDEYRSELTLVFMERYRDASGGWNRMMLWLDVVTGVAAEAPKEHGRMILQDFRYALRSMRRNRSFTAMTVLTLALGIGATTAVFSVVHGVLIQPLRYPQPNELISISHTAVFRGVSIDTFGLNSQMFVTYVDHNRAFQEFGVWSAGSATVTGRAEPHQVQTLVATQGVLPALGVQPALGRWFLPADDSPGTTETVILSHGYWQRRFGEDRAVIGRAITIDGRPREIVGVMPQSFRFLDLAAEVILPKRFDRSQLSLGGFGNRGLLGSSLE